MLVRTGLAQDVRYPHWTSFRAGALSHAGDVIAALFFVTAAFCVFAAGFWSDEGQQTVLGTQITYDNFRAGFFFQRLHPALSLLYLPTAGLGWTAFAILHVLVAALGVLAIGRWIDRLGGRGWLGALVVGASPPYFLGAVVGESNGDGVALLALALLLFDQRQPWCRLVSGVLLGALPWARYEMSAVAAPLVMYAMFWRRDWTLGVGAALFPLLYVFGGAVYHGSLAWVLRYPPVEPVPSALYDFFLPRLSVHAVCWLLATLAFMCTAWLVCLTSLRNSRARGAARVVLLTGTALLVWLGIGPFFQAGVPHHPRYFVACLPGLAVGLSLTPSSGAWTFRLRLLLGGVSLALLLIANPVDPIVLLVLTASLGPLAVSLSPVRWQPSVTGALVLLAAVTTPWTFSLLDGVVGPRKEASAVLQVTAGSPPRLLVTNIDGLAHRLRAMGYQGATAYVTKWDILMAVYQVANHQNGQYASIVESFRSHYAGGSLWPCDLERYSFQVGDLVVLGIDDRQRILAPPEVWNQRTERVAEVDSATILRVTSGPGPITLPPRPESRVFSATNWWFRLISGGADGQTTLAQTFAAPCKETSN